MSAAKFHSGVSFDQDTYLYIEGLAKKLQRPRSFVINFIIREYAEIQGESKESVPPVRADQPPPLRN